MGLQLGRKAIEVIGRARHVEFAALSSGEPICICNLFIRETHCQVPPFVIEHE
jgi:hypothetical protein